MADNDPLINAVAAVAGATSPVQPVPGLVKSLDVFLAVTAATGGTTPAVQCEIQWSYDGTTFFSANTTKDQFPDNTNTGHQVGQQSVKEFEIKGPYWRAVTTLSGAPTNITYRVDTRYTP